MPRVDRGIDGAVDVALLGRNERNAGVDDVSETLEQARRDEPGIRLEHRTTDEIDHRTVVCVDAPVVRVLDHEVDDLAHGAPDGPSDRHTVDRGVQRTTESVFCELFDQIDPTDRATGDRSDRRGTVRLFVYPA
ncbi:MAG: hypothetical protein KA129_02245 [Microthrixaceae bacterium]|jgi:hypothetical protein|nr:hypothetical protein [Microthrixaceae bacterium]